MGMPGPSQDEDDGSSVFLSPGLGSEIISKQPWNDFYHYKYIYNTYKMTIN